jgi:hypothetical protein
MPALYAQGFKKSTISQGSFVRAISMIDSSDPSTHIPPRVQIFTAIEQAGIVPRLVDYTSSQAAEQPELQFYATTALAHFAPGPRIAHSMFLACLSALEYRRKTAPGFNLTVAVCCLASDDSISSFPRYLAHPLCTPPRSHQRPSSRKCTRTRSTTR